LELHDTGFWNENVNGALVVKAFPNDGLNDVLVVEDVLEAGVNEAPVANTLDAPTLERFLNVNDEKAVALVVMVDS